MSDAELVAAMRARAGVMDARAIMHRRISKNARPGSAKYYDHGRFANALESRARYLRQAASSIETIAEVDP